MRTPHRWALAVRRPDTTIHVEAHDVVERFPRLRRTFLRGLVALVDAISIGWRAITISAQVSTGVTAGADQLGAVFVPIVAGALLVFIVVPGALPGPGIAGDVSEAAGRAMTLVIYLAMVSRTSQAQRMFAYHGAEHMTIAAFERHGRLPSRDEVLRESTIHVRCGTDFLTLFVLMSGVVYSFVPRRPLAFGALSRVALVPVVAALAYEVMRLAARHEGAVLARLATSPGRMLQRITTRRPSDDMLEIADAALRAAVPNPRPPAADA